jgi:hypothetical protein
MEQSNGNRAATSPSLVRHLGLKPYIYYMILIGDLSWTLG